MLTKQCIKMALKTPKHSGVYNEERANNKRNTGRINNVLNT